MPSRKQKPAESHSIQATAIFYNTISKVRLTRGALNEYDRRCISSLTDNHWDDAKANHNRSAFFELKHFARHGGPSLEHLRGFRSPRSVMNRSRCHGRGRTVITKVSPYGRDFEQKLDDIGVHIDDRISKPANLQQLQEHLAKRRASLSSSHFDEDEFDTFRAQYREAGNEAGITAWALPVIAGHGQDQQYRSKAEVLFSQITPFDKGITKAKPDRYDGVAPGDIERKVRKDLESYIIPSKNAHYPAVPNFFLEAKSNNGAGAVAERQACYDGAIGARAMHSLQNYGRDKPLYDGHARSFASTLHDGQLKLYATHVTEPKTASGQPEYHMSQLNGYAMTGNPKAFREGVTAYRNMRDMARTNRDSLVNTANERARDELR